MKREIGRDTIYTDTHQGSKSGNKEEASSIAVYYVLCIVYCVLVLVLVPRREDGGKKEGDLI